MVTVLMFHVLKIYSGYSPREHFIFSLKHSVFVVDRKFEAISGEPVANKTMPLTSLVNESGRLVRGRRTDS